MLTCLIGEWIDFKLDIAFEQVGNLQLVPTLIILVKMESITPLMRVTWHCLPFPTRGSSFHLINCFCFGTKYFTISPNASQSLLNHSLFSCRSGKTLGWIQIFNGSPWVMMVENNLHPTSKGLPMSNFDFIRRLRDGFLSQTSIV